MKCPYCGGEMTEGVIRAGLNNRDGVYWRPKTAGLKERLTKFYTEGFALQGEEVWSGVPAGLCAACGKIIIALEPGPEEG